MADRCPICDDGEILTCPECGTTITLHSHERDYHCPVHKFVWPIRQRDGVQINGDGLMAPVNDGGYWLG